MAAEFSRHRLRYYLSERFRLRFEDTGLEEMMDENASVATGQGNADPESNAEATDAHSSDSEGHQLLFGELDERNEEEDTEGDEFKGDAIKYQVLQGKIDALLNRLKLDA